MTTAHLTAAQLAAWPADDALFTLSASRLEKVGGKFGDPATGCDRKYAGEYCFDMRQSGSEAAELGSALHLMAEIYQATGEVADPESELAAIFQAGMHLINVCGRLLVEHEHVGVLPNGVPFVAYLDGHSEDGGDTNCVVVQDLKTTSDPKWALTPETLPKNVQSMLYAWILMCLPHWFCPPLADGHFGPKHWQWWDPEERGAKACRLRWLYFLTRGAPRAWEATKFVYPDDAHVYMQETILPLTERMRAAHQWRLQDPAGALSDVGRNLEACRSPRGSFGRWCGVGERGACEYGEIGTPLLQLVTGKKRPQLTAQQRLAALKSTQPPAAPAPPKESTPMSSAAEQAKARLVALQQRRAAATGATPPAAAPAPEAAAGSPPAQSEPAPQASGEETTPGSDASAPAEAPSESGPDTNLAPNVDESTPDTAATPAPQSDEPKRPRGRPKGSKNTPPAAPPGAGINPPEVVEALAAIAVDPLAGSKGATAAINNKVQVTASNDPLVVARALAELLPAGMSLTVQGVGK